MDVFTVQLGPRRGVIFKLMDENYNLDEAIRGKMRTINQFKVKFSSAISAHNARFGKMKERRTIREQLKEVHAANTLAGDQRHGGREGNGRKPQRR